MASCQISAGMLLRTSVSSAVTSVDMAIPCCFRGFLYYILHTPQACVVNTFMGSLLSKLKMCVGMHQGSKKLFAVSCAF